MTKQLVVIDVDDVLADTTEALRHFVNSEYGYSLDRPHYQVEGAYWGYYEMVWSQHDINGDGILDRFHQENSKGIIAIEPIEGAKTAINVLAKKFRLAAVSSRTSIQEEQTKRWLKSVFGDVFESVYCIDSRLTGVTKGDFCLKLGAKYLIDDNTEHCTTAAEVGVTPILFGIRGWQSEPERFTRCLDWKAVTEYFDGRS